MSIAQTLARSFAVEGVGLHTGAAARVEVRPAVFGRGRVFIRDGVEIPALPEFVVDTRRSTTLGRAGASVQTAEHLLAALLLAGIDDAEIAVEGPELPALDGAAQVWHMNALAAGLRPQDGEIPLLRVAGPRWIDDGDCQLFLCPARDLQLYAAIALPETAAERMIAGGAVADAEVRAQMLRARTYGLEWEVGELLANGLARGGSLENAVVLTHDGYLNDHVWPDEPAWHKVLDLAGDLALVGARIAGLVLAVRAGHRGHVALAGRLRGELRAGG